MDVQDLKLAPPTNGNYLIQLLALSCKGVQSIGQMPYILRENGTHNTPTNLEHPEGPKN
jgi:hypothetical protein